MFDHTVCIHIGHLFRAQLFVMRILISVDSRTHGFVHVQYLVQNPQSIRLTVVICISHSSKILFSVELWFNYY